MTGLSQEPSRSAHFAAWKARGRGRHTILDLDYRPMFWPNPDEASAQVGRALEHVTVAVGNREECEVAVGETEPHRAADALLERGVELAIVKQGPKGVLAATRDERIEVPPSRCRSSTASVPATRSAGPCATGCSRAGTCAASSQFANVAGAIVASRLECSTAMPTEAEVEERSRPSTTSPNPPRRRDDHQHARCPLPT